MGERRLPETLRILAPHVLCERGVMQVGHNCLGRKNEPVALLCQPEAQLLILAGLELDIKPAVRQEYLTAVAGRVIVDKVDDRMPPHVVIAVFVFRLDKPRHKACLFRAERALGAHDLLVGERSAHCLYPAACRYAVGFRKQDDRCARRLHAKVASSSQRHRRRGQLAQGQMGIALLPGHNQRAAAVAGSGIDDNDIQPA